MSREEIARDMQEVLEHFHFMLGRHRMIGELKDRFGYIREVNEARNIFNNVHLVPKFLSRIENEDIRAAFAVEISQIHAVAAHVRYEDRNNRDARGRLIRVVAKEASHQCKAVRDACRKLSIPPFAFASLEGDASARNDAPLRREDGQVRDDRRGFVRAVTAG